MLFGLVTWSQPALAQTVEIDVQGNAISIPDGSTAPNGADGTDFGLVNVSTTGTPHTFTILNTGAGNLTISSLTLSGLHNLDFAISGLATPTTVGAGNSVNFTVEFTPSGIGTRVATIEIISNDPDESPYTFDIAGDGFPPGEAFGTLSIAKSSFPSGGTGFNFVHDIEAPYTFTLDDGMTQVYDVVPGTYTITETVPSGWLLEFVNCFTGQGPGQVAAAGIGGGVDYTVSGNSLTVNVPAFTFVDCTFYNAEHQIDKETQSPTVEAGDVATYTIAITNTYPFNFQSVTITDTLPAGFTYRATGGITANGATRNSVLDPTVGDSELTWGEWDIAQGGSLLIQFTADVAPTVPPGTYDNAACLIDIEGVLDCDDGLVETDEDVTVLPRTGSITVVKQATPSDGTSFDFVFGNGQSSTPFSLTSGNSQQFPQLLSGTYVITESVPSDWVLTNVACDGGVSTTAIANGISVNLDGQDTTCTFTNASRPTLTVTKVVVNDNGGTGVAGDFTLNVAATNPSQTSFAGSASGTTITLDAGSYSVTETAAAGYTVSYSADCSGTIALGESRSCTVTNDDIPPGSGTLTIIKAAAPESSQSFSFSSPTLGNFTLIDDGSSADRQLFTVDANTNHAVTETVPAGWTLQSAVCDNGNPVDDIFVAEGASVTCTFTNAAIPGSITVTKTPSLDVALVGETVTYTYVVRNNGSVTLNNVVAVDDKLGNITLPFTTLIPGQETFGTASATVQAGDLPGPLVNTVVVTGTPPVGADVSANAQASVALVNASISLVKTVALDGASPACGTGSAITVAPGALVAYCYTVTNTGDVTLVSHSLTDDRLGEIFTDRAFTLAPGQSISNIELGVPATAAINAETTNVATWTAQTADLSGVRGAGAAANAGPLRVVTVQATATAIVQIDPNLLPPTALDEGEEPGGMRYLYLPLLQK
ncbi:MAG: choice-of-anchor D domain-containing protein [Caldilineaceae bacterium]